MKDMTKVNNFESSRRDEIMLGQAINNATAVLIASNPKLEGDFGEQYKSIIKMLYTYSVEAKEELERGE